MITMEIFLLGLLITSTLVSLATEAVKKILTEYDKSYHANTLAGIISIIVSAGVGVSYVIFTNTEATYQVAVYGAVLIFMSWLCAMVGYDKVIQTISQLKQVEKSDAK